MKPPMDAMAPSRKAMRVRLGSSSVEGAGAFCCWLSRETTEREAGVLGSLDAVESLGKAAAGAASFFEKKPMVDWVSDGAATSQSKCVVAMLGLRVCRRWEQALGEERRRDGSCEKILINQSREGHKAT
jgi:hypothetical protein